MGITPLTVAAVAGVLLVLSVAADLAFNQSVSLEVAEPDGSFVLIAEGPASGRYIQPKTLSEPLEVNRSDTLTLRIRLENGYPWPSSRTYGVTSFDCYSDPRGLGVFDVNAPARGVGNATMDVSVAKLLDGAGIYAPRPASEGPLTASVQLCRGTTSFLYGSIPIKEVPQ